MGARARPAADPERAGAVARTIRPCSGADEAPRRGSAATTREAALIHSSPGVEMKKLTLNVETLRVESFAVLAEFLDVVVEMTRTALCDNFTIIGPRCP